MAEKDRTDYGYALLPLFILRYKVQSQTHYLKFGQLPKNPVAEELANNLATLRQKASLTYEEIANRTQLLEQDHAIALEHGLIFDEDIEPDWVNELGDALGIDPSKLVSPLSEGHEKSLEAEHTSISSRLYTYKWYGMASIILIAIGSLLLVNRFDEVQPVEAGSVISTPIPTSTTNTQELAPPIVYVWTPTQTSLPLANPTYTPSPSATPTLTPEIPPTSLPAQCQVAGTDSSINIWSGPGGRRIDGGEIYSPIGWARSGSVFEIVAETHRGEYFLVSIEQSQVEAGNIRAHIGYKLESLGWVFASSCPRLNEESVPPPMTIPAILTPTPTRTPSPTPTHTASPTPTIVPPQLSIELRNLEWDPQSNSYPIHIIVTANNTSAIEFMTLEYYFDVQSGNRIEDQVTLLQSNSGQYIFEIRRGCGDETVLGYQIKAALINGELITEPNPGNFYTEIYPYCAY